jgi:hypothetical protein
LKNSRGPIPRVGSDGWFDASFVGLSRSQKAFARSGCSQQAATAQGEGRSLASRSLLFPVRAARRTEQAGAEAASAPGCFNAPLAEVFFSDHGLDF